jgi:hypothetical protein
MRAEKAVSALLAADAGVAAIVASRIFGAFAPDDTAAPLLVYRKLSASREPQVELAAPPQLVEALVEVLCVAPSYPVLKSLGEAVRVALVGQRGTVNGVDLLGIAIEEEGADEYEPQLREYAQAWTYRVQHTE